MAINRSPETTVDAPTPRMDCRKRPARRIRGFAFALVVGVSSGTYSTIYVATPVLIWLNNPKDKGKFKTCKSPYKKSKLKLGKHKLQIKATDAAGNVSLIKTIKWTVKAP